MSATLTQTKAGQYRFGEGVVWEGLPELEGKKRGEVPLGREKPGGAMRTSEWEVWPEKRAWGVRWGLATHPGQEDQGTFLSTGGGWRIRGR